MATRNLCIAGRVATVGKKCQTSQDRPGSYAILALNDDRTVSAAVTWAFWPHKKTELPLDRKKLGALGEKLAAGHLKKHGYRIVECNYHCREGEIDIVARQKDTLVFVEVRTKTGTAFGTPEESVTKAKKHKMVAAAFKYLRTKGNTDADWRIDLVAVQFDLTGKLTRIEIIENAVGG